MPRLAKSGTKGLYKNHARTCTLRKGAKPTGCACAWSGKHKGVTVVLAAWSGKVVDPRATAKAKVVLGRFIAAVDAETFDPAGERPATGTAQTFASFVADEWTTHYRQPRKLRSTSGDDMLGVLTAGRLGSLSLERLGAPGAVLTIQKWLNAAGKRRAWTDKTWNEYRSLLGRVCKQAVIWDRLATNPVAKIKARVAVQPDQFTKRHLLPDVEDDLFAVVDQLNVAPPRSTRGKLTQDQADAIRAALAAGEPGVVIAQRFTISAAVVSSIKHGDIWRGEAQRMGTKGTEMRRRLIAAFDGGLRAGEMLLLKLQHVNWRPVTMTTEAGKRIQGYVITLTPDMTKGGATTGKNEEVFAFTPRFVAALEARRFQLKNNPPPRQFLFGSEDGSYQASFDKQWTALFTLAKLPYGRDAGLVWHTIRHEFVSRLAEQTGDPVLTQKLARHKRLETTQLYFHARQDRMYAASAGLAR